MSKYKNSWEKIGKILAPNNKYYWSKSHMSLPTPLIFKDFIRIYFGSRDSKNRSRIGFLDYNPEKKKIKYIHKKPVIGLGNLGTFDDNGMMPCSVVRKGKSIMLYYVGWNPRSTVRFSFYSGLAISKDNGFTFKRYSRAPIIERTNLEPYVNASPMVIKIKKKYFMYYVSGEGWINPDLPRYNIKIATSTNGKEWKRLNKTAIDFKNKKENALARPCVVKFGSKYYMWFSKKGKNYRTGFAYSKDGINWKRNDSLVNLNIGKTSFDNKMICYPYIFSFKKNIYCIYNGNNYGYSGIGMAILKK
tara:strand:- start:98 stop:1006 length:909 start_codon:yes stop_codon:yes gene_type:complete